MNKEDIKELYEMRKLLEVKAVASAVAYHQAEDLIPLRDAIEEMKNASTNDEFGEGVNLRFHMAIAHATHNQILIHLMRSVSETMIRVLCETGEVLIYSEKKAVSLIKEHGLIYDAIKARQPEQA